MEKRRTRDTLSNDANMEPVTELILNSLQAKKEGGQQEKKIASRFIS